MTGEKDIEATAVPVNTSAPTTQTKYVEVVAPSNMSAGYTFNVDAMGKTMKVQVPNDVMTGQRFQALVVSEGPMVASGGGDGSHNIPTGRWRDGLCDCCDLGICHPVLCCGIWCGPCALGQLQTRMNLTYCGDTKPTTERPYWSPFKILMIVAITYAVVETILSVIANSQAEEEFNADGSTETTYTTFGYIVVFISTMNRLAFLIFMVLIMTKTRAQLRRTYQIPEETCNSCEDCCCAFWCSCCTVTQMLRHTADYKKYKAGCCEEDGLSSSAPSVV